jgi:two-component system sensor histidine kinase CpxA
MIRSIPRHRLFWKIILIFWLTTCATIIANILITREIAVNEFKQAQLKEKMLSLAKEASEVYEQQGSKALRQWYRSQAKREGIRVVLLNENGTPLIQPRPKRQTDEHEDDDLLKQLAPPLEAHLLKLADHPVTSTSGQQYILRMLPSRYLQTRFKPDALYGYRLIASFIIILLGSLWIARSIARPIRLLHQASLQMADGNLAIRVAGNVGTRKDELGQLARAFDQMADKVSNLLNTQQQLFRDISHEIRTPLTRQKLAIELARSSDTPDEYLARIEQQNQCIENLINQLLTLMQVDSIQIAHEPVSLTAMLQSCLEAAELELQRKTISIETDWQSEAIINGDPALLTRAFENLLVNAIKYSPENTGISIRILEDEQGIKVEINDEGPGIPEAELEAILKPFYRADQSRNRSTGGFGLGLAISSQIISKHGGKLAFENNKMKGLKVTISFPKEHGQPHRATSF